LDTQTQVLLIATAGTLLAAVIPSILNYFTSRQIREADERKQQREMVTKLALENWKQSAELMGKSGRAGQISPLDVFIVHMAKTAEIAFDPTTNETNIDERLSRVDSMIAVMTERADRLTKEARNRVT